MTVPALQPRPAPIGRDELIARYDGRTPRYTSYPTAVQFGPAVDEAAYRSWLAALPLDQAVSLYVHVPFCSRICWYCGCNTRATTRAQPVTDYVDWLIAEMELLRAALPGTPGAKAIHLGGGTPNLLSRDDMTRLFATVQHVFRLSPGIEIAAELDPAVLTQAWVKAAALHGLSRASLGVQDLSPEVQAAVNRIEPFEVIERAVGWLREADVPSINMDLIYGLPKQTTADVIGTLDAVLTLKPDRLALFGYAHVPWMKINQQLIEDEYLPGPAERLDQSEAAAERLVSEGYVQIGLDHFALPTDDLAAALAEGRLHRNFQGYTTDATPTLIGLGASSIGRLPQGFVQNLTQEKAWRDALRENRLPVARGVALTDEDRFRGDIIERLMCDLTVDLDTVCARHGRPPESQDDAVADLAPFVADGLVEIAGRRITITPAGRALTRSVCAVFDAYLDRDALRHARAL